MDPTAAVILFGPIVLILGYVFMKILYCVSPRPVKKGMFHTYQWLKYDGSDQPMSDEDRKWLRSLEPPPPKPLTREQELRKWIREMTKSYEVEKQMIDSLDLCEEEKLEMKDIREQHFRDELRKYLC